MACALQHYSQSCGSHGYQPFHNLIGTIPLFHHSTEKCPIGCEWELPAGTASGSLLPQAFWERPVAKEPAALWIAPLTGLCLRCLGGGGDDADLPVPAVLSRREDHPAHCRGRPQGRRHRVVQTHTQMVAMDTSLPVCSTLLLDDSRLLQGPQQVCYIFYRKQWYFNLTKFSLIS